MADIVLSAVDGRGVATVTLNRPEVHNAYDGALIDGLLGALGRWRPTRACASWCCGATANTFRPAPTSPG